jgi:hypothetical protein
MFGLHLVGQISNGAIRTRLITSQLFVHDLIESGQNSSAWVCLGWLDWFGFG